MAGIPTFVKAYKYPETENWGDFFGSFVNAFITMLTLKTWTFQYWSFPLNIVIYDLSVFILVKYKLGKRISKSFEIAVSEKK